MNTKIQNNKMSIGDRINIIDWDEQYTTDTEWFKDHLADLKSEWLINYRYDNCKTKENEGREYKILYIDTSEDKILVGEMIYGILKGVYLFDNNGIEVRKPEKKEYRGGSIMHDWIPINEHEPKTADHVLVTYKWGEDDYEVSELDYGVVKNLASTNDNYCRHLINHIIAWRYMPKPYKER